MISEMKKIIVSLFLSILGYNAGAQELPAWAEGMLDIHHISTGRGDAAFLILPDGTTLLIDAGDMSEASPRTLSDRNCQLRPDNSLTAPEWIVRSIRTFHPQRENASLDYVSITHYHSDHYGAMDHLRKDSGNGYKLTGITEVGHHLQIRNLIDRGLDDGMTEEFIKAVPTLHNYHNFIEYQSANSGLQHHEFKVGSNKQITLLKSPGKYPDFEVRNIYGSGKIWDGYNNDSSFVAVPAGAGLNENNSSTGIRITYGLFDYFAGGDISGVDGDGYFPPQSMEAQAAPVIGPVDAATLNHHGNRDSMSPSYVRTVRPRVWVLQNWTSDHPGPNVLRRLLSERLYPGPRDIYVSCLLDAGINVLGEIVNRMEEQTGHIVIRVYPGGENYSVFVLDDHSPEYNILQQKDYKSR
jgi:beta-lactamase superfamily II metal-dependent hydrolase